MKSFSKLFMLLACLTLVTAAFTSCEFDTSPEPEHPLYVTYTISAGTVQFDGPELLLTEIQTWIKKNQVVYDKSVKYSTGEASEFTKTDTEAIKKYSDEFLPKFKKYLNDLSSRLAAGEYGDEVKVNAIFYVTAHRTQGYEGSLRYEEIKYAYPFAE